MPQRELLRSAVCLGSSACSVGFVDIDVYKVAIDPRTPAEAFILRQHRPPAAAKYTVIVSNVILCDALPILYCSDVPLSCECMPFGSDLAHKIAHVVTIRVQYFWVSIFRDPNAIVTKVAVKLIVEVRRSRCLLPLIGYARLCRKGGVSM